MVNVVVVGFMLMLAVILVVVYLLRRCLVELAVTRAAVVRLEHRQIHAMTPTPRQG